MATNTYYIQASVICTNMLEETVWDQGYWARITTSEIEDVIRLANTIYDKMYRERSTRSWDPRLIIDLISDYNRNEDIGFHQHLYIKMYPGTVTVEDLDYDMEKIVVNLSEVEYLSCYLDDLHISDEECLFSSSDED